MRTTQQLFDLTGKTALVTGGSRGLGLQKMTKGLLQQSGEENLIKPVALQRLGDDEDLKGVAALLASNAGKHISGQVIAVGGGYSAVR